MQKSFMLGVVLGGRLGFCLFYQPAWFTSHPLDVFKVWQGGMSAHGGMIGCIIAMLVFARTRGKRATSPLPFRRT